MASGLGDFAKSVGNTITGGLVNSIGQFIGNQQNLDNQKELARYTSQLQQDAWNSQFSKMNARQDQLNRMSALVTKNALQNAGLSVSGDNNFASFSGNPSQGNGVSPSLGSGTGVNVFGDFQGALAANRLADAQAKLADAQADKTRKETSWIDRLNSSGVAFTDAQTKQIEEMTPVQRDKFLAETDNLKKQGESLVVQINKFKTEITNLEKQGKSIDLDNAAKEIANKYLDEKGKAELDLLLKELELKDMDRKVAAQQLANLVLTGESIRLGNTTIRLNNERIEFDNADNKAYKDVERRLQTLKGAMDVCVGMANAASSPGGAAALLYYQGQFQKDMDTSNSHYERNMRKQGF